MEHKTPVSRPTLHKPEDRILLCLQFYSGDKKQAMELAKFISDLQPGKCENADFLFVSRFDCTHDEAVIREVSKKFRVFHYISKRRGTGWPIGPNELWFGTMEWVFHMMQAKKVPQYKMVFTFESDCVPLSANWVSECSRAWDRECAKHETFVFGALLQYPGWHINGNAMFSGNPAFLHWLVKQVGGVQPNGGWDYILYADFKRWGARDFPQLKSYWNCKHLPESACEAEIAKGTIFLHGVKDRSLLDFARRKLLA